MPVSYPLPETDQSTTHLRWIYHLALTVDCENRACRLTKAVAVTEVGLRRGSLWVPGGTARRRGAAQKSPRPPVKVNGGCCAGPRVAWGARPAVLRSGRDGDATGEVRSSRAPRPVIAEALGPPGPKPRHSIVLR